MRLTRRHREALVPGTQVAREQKSWTLELRSLRVTVERVIGLYGLPDTVAWSVRWWRAR